MLGLIGFWECKEIFFASRLTGLLNPIELIHHHHTYEDEEGADEEIDGNLLGEDEPGKDDGGDGIEIDIVSGYYW